MRLIRYGLIPGLVLMPEINGRMLFNNQGMPRRRLLQ
jgi:hypothetical protein